ncbi:uncharacterized protein LOC125423327 isoform X2 [Ziziphus jujuba]|uniref:Uncharacterized protein LOC125423327 isoform X2 n=1 Tax=Ziziphus jujuba TaxID=326968 RepID=A0ABM3IPU8_ZIZJJ|nr:uncharacterized protein LOC125423327 isoform X2 [Ziziphus jujuba]
MEASLVVAEVMEAKGGAQNKINDEKLTVAVVGNGGASKIASGESKKKKNKNRIHVSNNKKLFYFYINHAKEYIEISKFFCKFYLSGRMRFDFLTLLF